MDIRTLNRGESEQAMKLWIDSYPNPPKLDDEYAVLRSDIMKLFDSVEKSAEENGFKIEKHPADWAKFGRSAGPERNEQMAKLCDYVICFWDGKSRGTKSMIEFAEKYKKCVKIKNI